MTTVAAVEPVVVPLEEVEVVVEVRLPVVNEEVEEGEVVEEGELVAAVSK
jgi:hypothetical protein